MKFNYNYIGIDTHGRHIRGRLCAVSIDALSQQLSEQHIYLVSAELTVSACSLITWLKNRPVARRALQDWCFQLHLLLKSGIVIADAINFIIEQKLSPRLDNISTRLLSSLRQGQKLSEVLSNFSHCFDSVFISLIQLGEKTGKLTQCLEHLLHYLDWQHKFKEQITRALIYPILLGVITIAMICILFVTLIPQMQQFLSQQSQQLPLLTQLLMATSIWFKRYTILTLAGLFTLSWCIKLACIFSIKFKCLMDQFKLKLPKIGAMLYMIEAERFTYTLQILYRSGIDIIDCLNQARCSLKNAWLISKLQKVTVRIQQGELLSQALIAEQIFQDFLAKIVSVGEKSGHLDDALTHAGQFYLQNLQRRFDIIAATIGPVFILVLGLILMWVAMAIFIPLYDNLAVLI